MKWPDDEVVITSLGKGKELPGKIANVELLGHTGQLTFRQDDSGLRVKMPSEKPCDFAYTLKLSGLHLQSAAL
jgi:alpha-L-fucosidase